jgi:hypothetical protein
MLDPPPPGALIGVAWRPQQKLPPRDQFLEILRESVTLMEERHVLPFAPSSPSRKQTAHGGAPAGGAR